MYVSDSPIKMARVMNVAYGHIGKHVNSWSALLIEHTTATGFKLFKNNVFSSPKNRFNRPDCTYS